MTEHSSILSTPYTSLLRRYLFPLRKRVFVLAAVLFLGIGLQLIHPQIVREFIDTALEAGAAGKLIGLAVLFLVLGLLNQVISALTTYLGADVGWLSTNALREDIADHCLRLDMSFHNKRTPGSMIERIDGDITALSNFFSQFLIRIVGNGLLTLGVLVLLYRENAWVGMALALFTVISILFLLRCRRLAIPATIEQREASSTFFGFMEEMLTGVEDIRANAGGRYVMSNFLRGNHRFFHSSRKSWMLRSSIWLLLLLTFSLADVLAISMGIVLYNRDIITIGTVFMFFHYTEMLRHPIGQLTLQLQNLQNAGASIERATSLLAMKKDLPEKKTGRIPNGPIAVTFEDVNFHYGDGNPVLHEVSLKLSPGNVLGLLGRTGSGKTTISRLLFRFYDVTTGAILLNGMDVRHVPLDELRSRIGVVTQDVQLFDGSIRENLTFFDKGIPDKQLLGIIDTLGLSPLLSRWPEGLDSRIQSGGKGLSAGEAQLLAFVRVFLKNPDLLILDEPSACLDPATEKMIQQAWALLLKNRTGIVIAHRLSTISLANEILILEDGRVKEQGAREHLATDPHSRFSELLSTGFSGVTS